MKERIFGSINLWNVTHYFIITCVYEAVNFDISSTIKYIRQIHVKLNVQ